MLRDPGCRRGAGVEANTAGVKHSYALQVNCSGATAAGLPGAAASSWAGSGPNAVCKDLEDQDGVSLFLLSPAEGGVCQGSTGPWERTIVGEKRKRRMDPLATRPTPHTRLE